MFLVLADVGGDAGNRMPVDDLVLLVIHDDDVAVERFDPAGDVDLVLERYGHRRLVCAVGVQHSVKEIQFHIIIYLYSYRFIVVIACL